MILLFPLDNVISLPFTMISHLQHITSVRSVLSEPTASDAGLSQPSVFVVVSLQLTPQQADQLLAASLAEVLRRCAASETAAARLLVPPPPPPAQQESDSGAELPAPKRRRVLPEGFHSNLRYRSGAPDCTAEWPL